MIVTRAIMQVTFTWNTDWVNVHVHEADDQGATWAIDYQLSDQALAARATAAGKTAWDNQDILDELEALHPLS